MIWKITLMRVALSYLIDTVAAILHTLFKEIIGENL